MVVDAEPACGPFLVHALKQSHRIGTVEGMPVRAVTEAMASLVEQSAYTWFAQEALNAELVSVDTAAQVVTSIWCRAFFGDGVPTSFSNGD